MAAVEPGPVKPVPWPVAGRRLRSNRLPAATATSAAIAGTQLLDEEPVKSSTALANASGFSSGMK